MNNPEDLKKDEVINILKGKSKIERFLENLVKEQAEEIARQIDKEMLDNLIKSSNERTKRT